MKSFLRIFLIFTLILSVSTSGQYVSAKEKSSTSLSGHPSVLYANPKSMSKNVPINTEIAFTFDRPVKFGNEKTNFYNADTWDRVDHIAIVMENTVFIKPLDNLHPFTKYYVSVDDGCVSDNEGNGNEFTQVSLTTSGKTAPRYSYSSPFDLMSNFSPNSPLTIRFDENIKLGTGTVSLVDMDKKPVEVKTSVKKDTLTITPTSELEKDSMYMLDIADGMITNDKGVGNYNRHLRFTTGKGDGEDPDEGEVKTISLSVVKGTTVKLKIDGGKSPYSVSSDNSKIVTAKLKGSSLEIKGAKEGTATVTVTDKNGNKIEFKIDVISSTVSF